jgi:glycosyltransferase involved in cell wall biosynthesis
MVRIQYDHQIFSMQRYGGISRYFANLQRAVDDSTGFKQHNGVLFSENHYLKKPGSLPPAIGKAIFKKEGKIAKWNKRYSTLFLKYSNYDVFHPTYYDPYFLSYTKKPFVLTVHDMIHELFPENFHKNDVYAGYKKRCILEASHLIAISENTKKDLQRLFSIPDGKITVIHHGIDLRSPEYSPVSDLPQQYLLFVGERVGYKNFGVLTEAFSRLSKEKSGLFLVLAGGGPLTAEEKADLSSKQILDKVIQITATDTELNTLYKMAICFVFPSLYEGFGLPILEAFKNSCPVILSNCSCFPEIAGAQAALYFDATSSRSLANQIAHILSDESKRNELVVQGQARLSKYPIAKCIQETLAVYKAISAGL